MDAYSLPSPTTRKAQQAKKRHNPGKLFFYNGEPFSTVKVNRGMDILVAFNFAKQEEQMLSFTDVTLRRERVWRTGEVERILNRSFVSFYRAWHAGVPRPFKAVYEHRKDSKVGLLWSEKDIFTMHEYLVNNPRGRRPKDPSKIVANASTPSRAEVRARLRGEETVYVKTKDGEFVPTWKASQFGL